MFGNDEAVRNGGAGSKERGNSALSVKVASDTPDVGEHFSDERRVPSNGGNVCGVSGASTLTDLTRREWRG